MLLYYIYPALKQYCNEETQKKIENEITQEYGLKIEDFEQRCIIGENDSHIATLIRDDLVDDFITYINRNNISLSNKIKDSFFENNSMFYMKSVSLIEYAAYYGSIQIFQYLKYNKVKLTSSLWLFAVLSNNPEKIQILEDNEIKPVKYSLVIEESIKCHHNDITNYLINNYLGIEICFL